MKRINFEELKTALKIPKEMNNITALYVDIQVPRIATITIETKTLLENPTVITTSLEKPPSDAFIHFCNTGKFPS